MVVVVRLDLKLAPVINLAVEGKMMLDGVGVMA